MLGNQSMLNHNNRIRKDGIELFSYVSLIFFFFSNKLWANDIDKSYILYNLKFIKEKLQYFLFCGQTRDYKQYGFRNINYFVKKYFFFLARSEVCLNISFQQYAFGVVLI